MEEVPASLPRPRSHQTVIPAGKALDGQELGQEDASGYTPKQKYVLDKQLKLDPTLKKAWEETNGRQARNVFVNSLVPRDVAYAMREVHALLKNKQRMTMVAK